MPAATEIDEAGSGGPGGAPSSNQEPLAAVEASPTPVDPAKATAQAMQATALATTFG